MNQVAFDTQKFVETLENAGLSKDQAKAISIAVCKSHEVVDMATKRDLEDVKKDIDMEFNKVEVRIQSYSEKKDSKIAEVKRDISDVRKELSTEITDVRKDIAQRDKRLNFSEKRFDRLEIKFDRLQWFLLAGILSLLFKDVILKLLGS